MSDATSESGPAKPGRKRSPSKYALLKETASGSGGKVLDEVCRGTFANLRRDVLAGKFGTGTFVLVCERETFKMVPAPGVRRE